VPCRGRAPHAGGGQTRSGWRDHGTIQRAVARHREHLADAGQAAVHHDLAGRRCAERLDLRRPAAGTRAGPRDVAMIAHRAPTEQQLGRGSAQAASPGPRSVTKL
jgi:hypothetical protein